MKSTFCKINFRRCNPSILTCWYDINLFNSIKFTTGRFASSLFFTKNRLFKNWFPEGLNFLITPFSNFSSTYMLTLASFLFKITVYESFCCLGFTRSAILNPWTISKIKLSLPRISQDFRKYLVLFARRWFVLLTLSLLWTPLKLLEGTTYKGPLPLLIWNSFIVIPHLFLG